MSTHGYTIIGSPTIEPDYSDTWETTMVFELRRDDGTQDTIWVCAGVPDWQRGSSVAAGHRIGFEDVWVFGGALEEWCGRNLYEDLTDADGDIDSARVADEKHSMLREVYNAALDTARERREQMDARPPE